MSFNKLSEAVRNFHNEERGDAIQSILVVAAAAIILVGVIKFVGEKVAPKVDAEIVELGGVSVDIN